MGIYRYDFRYEYEFQVRIQEYIEVSMGAVHILQLAFTPNEAEGLFFEKKCHKDKNAYSILDRCPVYCRHFNLVDLAGSNTNLVCYPGGFALCNILIQIK